MPPRMRVSKEGECESNMVIVTKSRSSELD